MWLAALSPLDATQVLQIKQSLIYVTKYRAIDDF
jgi:hypothetical protein